MSIYTTVITRSSCRFYLKYRIVVCMNMDMLSLLYVAVIVISFVLYLPPAWNSVLARRTLAGIIAVASGFGVGSALFLAPGSLLWPLAAMQMYGALNMFRVVENRMNVHYMYRSTARTLIVVVAIQLLYTAAWWILSPLNTMVVLGMALILQLVFAVAIYMIVVNRIRRSRFTYKGDALHNATPTVTVAIPARNETKGLEQCLRSLLKTNYSKLEILVLDDCSQGSRTSEIIRSFAHDGVRFVKGENVRDYWLAKNQAYDTLTDHANGELILFCGVDTRFEPQTIQHLVNHLLLSKQRMLSCMPLRKDGAVSKWAPAQFNRYFHELAYPAFVFRRPPVLSTTFLMYRKDVLKFGGFDAVRRTINPEGYFAKQLEKTRQYSFVRSTKELGLTSVKTSQEQRATAIRTLYPQLTKQPEKVLGVTLVGCVGIYGPLILMVLAVLQVVPVLVGVAAVSIKIVWLLTYLQVVRATGLHKSIRALLYSPLVTAYDLVLLHISMIKYEFSEVIWKGRNVCEPIMHVLPHLPSLDEERKS